LLESIYSDKFAFLNSEGFVDSVYIYVISSSFSTLNIFLGGGGGIKTFYRSLLRLLKCIRQYKRPFLHLYN